MSWLAISAAGLALVALLLQLLQVRRRLGRIPVLVPSTAIAPFGVQLVAAPGAQVDAAVLQSAADHLRAHDLDALDLIPHDFDVASAIEIASAYDPAALATDPFARTAGAGCAIVVRDELLSRAGLETPRDQPQVALAAERLRRFAVGRTGVAIAPGLEALPAFAPQRSAMLRARTGPGMGPALYLTGIRWSLLAIAMLVDVRVGLATLLIWSALPTLMLAGLPLRPRDRWRSLIERVPRDLVAWVTAVMQPERTDEVDAARPAYAQLLAGGTAPFFNPRRDRCPICDDTRLSVHVSMPDQLQRKPGHFTLERCAACGVIFQNPALTPRGLGFYYRDFYDGLGGDLMDDIFASTHPLYGSRVASVTATGVAPARWLDVGCGFAHFSLAARRLLPGTRFEGLDQSQAVLDAERRRWIDQAWTQSLEDLSQGHERFDVVSLFHYLEHTQDPAADLRAAGRLLIPSGRLILEIPNPRCRLGWLLGRWWFPWFQPQHQFLLDETAVRRLLAAAGLEPVSVTYLMTAGDVLLAALLLLRRGCSAGDVPWAPRPGAWRRVTDAAIWAAGLPLLVAALIIDVAYAALPASPTTSNALRVVAAPAGK